MANLTVTVNDWVLRRARIRALEQGKSVNAVVALYLERFAGMGATAEALSEFLELADRSTAASGPGGRAWRRDDLYDRPIVR